MTSPKECIEQILQKNNLTEPDKRPLYQYQINDVDYEVLKQSVLRRLKSATVLGQPITADDRIALIFYIVNTFRRKYVGLWNNLEELLGFDFDKSLIDEVIQQGLDYWGRPILETHDGSKDYISSLYAETGDVIQTPKMLLNGIIQNAKGAETDANPRFLFEYTIDNKQYVDIKNSLRFYYHHCENTDSVEYKLWAALFCLFASKTKEPTWEEFENLLNLNFDRQQREGLVNFGLKDFWGRSLLQKNDILDYQGSLIAESGNTVKTPKTLLNEFLSVGYDFSQHNYIVRKKPEYEELQNSLIFYKSYALDDSHLAEEVIAWAAAFCLFVAETYQNNTSSKTNWAWEDFESLIDCDFDDEIRENLLRLGLEKFWGGTVNSKNLLLSLGITEVVSTIAVDDVTNANDVTEIDSPQAVANPPEEEPVNPSTQKPLTGLDLYENDLKLKISQNSYPFLGLYGIELTVSIRTAIQDEIAKLGGTVNSYIQRLNTHPAIFSVYLAKSIADGAGQNAGALEIYPVIESAINIPPISIQDRVRLWQAFRNACKSLGMKISPKTAGPLFMSDEYLLQAGIPEAFLPDVTTKMFNLANRIGLPSYDPQQFQQWQNTFNNSLVPPFPQTAKRSLLLDEDGFYIKKFIELYQAGKATPTNPSKTESIMLGAIKIAQDGGTGILPIAKPKLEVPQFIFRDTQIGVLLPSSETNQTWEITTTDQYQFQSTFKYQIHLDEQFIPFGWSPLILKVEVKNVDSELSLDFNVWEENDSTDRFLLFSESGEIHTTSSKNDIEKLQLEIGRYVLFSRFEPNEHYVPISQQPNVFKSEIDLAAGQQIQISNNFIVETLNVATMSWTGNSVRSNEGTEIFPSENLILTVNVPQDKQIYRVVLSSDAGNSIWLDVTHLNDIFNLSDKFTQNDWQPCVTRLVVKLILVGGNNKTVASSSLWVWIGLKNVNGRITFYCDALPKNFDQAQSQDFLIENNNLTYIKNQHPHFSFVFNRLNGQSLTLTWRKPHIFLQLEDVINGLATVTPIAIGTENKVATTHNSQRKLRIFYNLDGTLSMGGFNQQVNFSRYGEYTLSLASLLGNVKPGNNILRYASPKGVSVDLITLVEPSVTNFDVIANVGQTKTIHINYTNSIDNLRLVFTELSANKTHEVMVGKTPGVLKLPFGATVHFTAEMIDANNWQHILTIDYQNLVDGVWFVDFETEQFGGEWKKLTNSVGHVVGFGLLMQNGVLLNDQPHQFIPATNLLLLNSITQKLSVRYENEAWQYLKWLNTLWNRLIRTTHLVANNIAPLLNLLGIPLQQSDEIPQQHILAAFPQLLAQSADCYANLDTQNNLLLLYLRTFSNVKNIDIQKLKNSDRYFEAQQKLEERYNNTLPNAGDSLGFALNLSQKLNNPALLNVIFNPNLNNLPNAGNFVLAPLGNPVLDDLEKLLSILAFASRLDASNGNNNYGEQIKVVANNIAENRDIFLKILSYIFTIGEDLLGFYLLYWEANL
jgi:hypothetical protein